MTTRTAAAIAVLLSLAGGASGQTTCTFVGPSGGDWSVASNWSPAVVPANNGGDTFNVIVPAGKLVYLDLPGLTTVTGASLEPGSTIALQDTGLDVLGVSLLESVQVLALGPTSSFSTHAPFVSGSSQRVQANDGASVRLELSTYFWSDDEFNTTVMLAGDPGSVIALAGTALIDATAASIGGTSYTYDMIATAGGVLDFSDVTTVRGAGGNEWLRFRAEPGGVVDLSGLFQTSAGRTWFEPAGGTLLLGNLNSAINATVGPVPPGVALDLASLTSLDGSQLLIEPGGTVLAPVLSSFVNSSATLSTTRVLAAPPLTEIDNSRFVLEGGLAFAAADTSYLWTNDWTGATLLHADGAGTSADLSSVQTYDASAASTGGTSYSYDVIASGGATVDLSGVETLRGAGGNEWLRFIARSGGSIDLSSAAEVTTGRVWLELDGGTLSLPALETLRAGRLTVPIFETLSLPSLVAATSTLVELDSGATLDAPLLTDFSSSTAALTPSTFFNTAALTQIDNALLRISGGLAYAAVADTDYFWTLDRQGETVMSVTGVGSVLDLSSLALLDATEASTGGTSYQYRMVASSGGTLDLTGLADVRGAGGNEWLDLAAVEEGRLLLGDVTQTDGRLSLTASNPLSVVEIAGDVSLGIDGGQAGVRAELLAEFRVSGDWSYSLNGGFHDASGGSIHLVSETGQSFEVGGADIGVPDDVVSGNHEWGSMVVGRDGRATVVALTDSVDNGNRGGSGEPEALYLVGFPQGDDGLGIRGGSTLILNDLQMYVGTVGGWVHINALFGPDDFVIPYDGGFIQLRDCRADWNGDGTVNTQDFLAYLNAWSGGDLSADLNDDGVVNTLDFLVFLGLWSAGCG